ncbi:hypothetical protein P154DRAFT_455656 [Amniculicola lignicola CBS 123094]|uniref:Uncharacterized protein n=1 Tax=Amniculicola lignicola CBS 123094 TaxID=1392246 RepID=A0A6A5WYC7_9PLEO|nr:hypothetical protein P154DRAFT_455656 [Amniculicola lignicola CBS 123094]
MPLIKQAPPSASSTTTTSTGKPAVPPFADCTRTTFEPGKTDWFQITGIPDIDICPDCYNTSIKPTPYSRFISTASPKPEDVSTRCDFGDTWIRIAWAWTYTQSFPDLSLLGQVAQIAPAEGKCPNLDTENEEVKKGGKPPASRVWYCLNDPKTGELVEDMTMCSHCITHICTILPSLNGIFLPAAGGQQALATCDLMVPKQSRTFKYIDQILEVAEKALDSGRERDVTPLVAYIRKWAPIPVCPKWERVSGQKCYNMASVAPEWTICEECYITHIGPITNPATAPFPRPLILMQISATPSVPSSGFTCQLYSARLQQYFKDACTTNNVADLKRKVGERDRKLVEVKRELERMRAQYDQFRMQAEYHYQMMVINQSSALAHSIGWVGSGWSVPTNTHATNESMNRGGEAALQADMIWANLKALEKEWADDWE